MQMHPAFWLSPHLYLWLSDITVILIYSLTLNKTVNKYTVKVGVLIELIKAHTRKSQILFSLFWFPAVI